MPLEFRIGRGLLATQLILGILLLPVAGFVASVGIWLAFAGADDLGAAGRVAVALFMLGCGVVIGAAALLVLHTFRAFRRLRLAFHTDRLEATLPRWNGLSPRAPAATTFHPWRELAALEWREEIYRGFLMPAVYETWTLITTSGERRKIGQSNAMSTPLPFETIAAALRERGVPTVDAPPLDRGGMWRPLFGRAPAKADPVGAAVLARRRRVMPVVLQVAAAAMLVAAILRACAA